MTIHSKALRVETGRTIVIGSGCAGLNAADWLYDLGERDVLLVTEGLGMGTSRNTGSDKQTYYKLSLAAGQADSVDELAQTLHVDGVHGDLALSEAAGSVQAFFKLVQLGVAFPTNGFGEFVGYRTDHDPRQRATSAGPLTSRDMVRALERQVLAKGIRILSPLIAHRLLTTPDGGICGALAYDVRRREHVLLRCAHIVLATGGPAQLYARSVYPACHTGMSGMALEIGAAGANLHHWQYGLASIGFRWNVSGSYQQVLPRYIAVDPDGTEHEFLYDGLPSREAAWQAVFLKGYQWPFDVAKVHGSSQVDYLVYLQTQKLGRRVYMDFRRNPTGLDPAFTGLDLEARAYLERSGAMQDTPIERLRAMNPQAIALYASHGIDLARDPLEIDVCAQHHNGGLAVDAHWRTNVPGLYAVGEAAGTFGAYRPGGSALNSTQVGSLRAAQHIAYDSRRTVAEPEAFERAVAPTVASVLAGLDEASVSHDALLERRAQARADMSRYAAFLRNPERMRALALALPAQLDTAWVGGDDATPAAIPAMIKYRDQLICQQAVLSAMDAAAMHSGSSGAGLVLDAQGTPINADVSDACYAPSIPSPQSDVCTTRREADGTWTSHFEPTRPMPMRDTWFESAWRDYRVRTEKATPVAGDIAGE